MLKIMIFSFGEILGVLRFVVSSIQRMETLLKKSSYSGERSTWVVDAVVYAQSLGMCFQD